MIVLALGFDHVSDDDFARVTIAQSFAHAPRLDPSGTSWLPFPFWMLGGAMAVFGRSLAVARVASIAFASLAATLPYLALRMTGSTTRRAGLALAFALTSPWSLWLGAATVPESVTASLAAAAVIALGTASGDRPSARARVGFALALLAACLSRYETWPIAAVLAVVMAVRAARALQGGYPREGHDTLVVTLVVAGPLLWIAWNMHAHGDALHFFQRVTRFKRALGEAPESTASALLLFPRLFVAMRPDAIAAAAAAIVAARTIAAARDELRRRWLVPLACVAAQLAFLAYGNARDGAPAHHSERALLGAAVITAAFAADVLGAAAEDALARARGLALGAAGLVTVAWLATWTFARGDTPGAAAADDRRAQIAAGNALREEGATQLELTPCAYEHFALIAAFRAPERVTNRPSAGTPVSPSCPAVERR